MADDVRALVAEKDLKETIRASRDYATLLVYYTENPSNQTEHPKTSAMKNADTLFAAELMRHSASLLTSQAETIARLERENGKLRELAAGLLMELEETPCYEDCANTAAVLEQAVKEYTRIPPYRFDSSIYMKTVDAHLARKEGT